MSGDALALRCAVDTEPDHSVRVVTGADWLNANQRGHWRLSSDTIRLWRHAAGWAARAAKVPPLGRAYVLAELRFADRRRRDPANWYPTVKACVDGLVDVGVLPGDSAEHLIGPDLRLGPVDPGVGRGSLTLHLWRLP